MDNPNIKRFHLRRPRNALLKVLRKRIAPCALVCISRVHMCFVKASGQHAVTLGPLTETWRIVALHLCITVLALLELSPDSLRKVTLRGPRRPDEVSSTCKCLARQGEERESQYALQRSGPNDHRLWCCLCDWGRGKDKGGTWPGTSRIAKHGDSTSTQINSCPKNTERPRQKNSMQLISRTTVS